MLTSFVLSRASTSNAFSCYWAGLRTRAVSCTNSWVFEMLVGIFFRSACCLFAMTLCRSSCELTFCLHRSLWRLVGGSMTENQALFRELEIWCEGLGLQSVLHIVFLVRVGFLPRRTF